jgi:hypothetical protein
MSLVWAVIKGDLATSVFWAVVWAVGTIAVQRWQARRAPALPRDRAPAWARGVKTPEDRFRIALMRRRRWSLRRAP